MEVFLLLYLLGSRAAQIGPLPMTYLQCQEKAAREGFAPIEDAWKKGVEVKIEGRVLTRDEVKLICEERSRASQAR